MYVLDEIVRWPDPVSVVDLQGVRIAPENVFGGVRELQRMGYVDRAGVQYGEDGALTLFGVTPAGLEFWEKNVKPWRKRPALAKPIPKHSVARKTLALSPRDVFDLWRVPCTLNLETGKRGEFDLWDGNVRYRG